MESRKQTPPVNQGRIIAQIKKFLEPMHESFIDGGCCNGFTVMLLRSVICQQTMQYFKRLHTLSRASDVRIKKLASLLLKYHDERNKGQARLKERLQESKGDADKICIRTEFEKEILSGFSNEESRLLSYAKELYSFINSLIFVQKILNFQLIINGKLVSQNNFFEIINVIPPDLNETLSLSTQEEKLPLTLSYDYSFKKLLSLCFDFSENELADTLSKLVYENEFLNVFDCSHITLLYKLNGSFKFYDSNEEKGLIIKKNSHAAAKHIKNTIVDDQFGGKKKFNLPIGFTLFGRTRIARPDGMALIHEMSSKRGKKIDPAIHVSIQQALLEIAVMSQNSEMWKELLRMKVDPHHPDDRNLTPTIAAVQLNYVEFFKFMATQNIFMNGYGNTDYSPLLIAAGTDNLDIVRIILEQHPKNEKIDINFISRSGQTVMMAAAFNGNIPMLELFKKHGGDPNLENTAGCTPAIIAAKSGKVAVLEWLARNNVDLTKVLKNGLTTLHAAAEYNRLDVVKMLEPFYSSLDIQTDYYASPLHLAAYFNHVELARFLTSRKVDLYLTRNGKTPAMYAAQEGSIGVLKILGDCGVNFKNETIQRDLLNIAIERNKRKVIYFLMQHGMEPDQIETVLDNGIKNGNASVIKFCIIDDAEQVILFLLSNKIQKANDLHPIMFEILKNERNKLMNTYIKILNVSDNTIGETRQFIEELRKRKTIFSELFIHPEMPGKFTRLFFHSRELPAGRINRLLGQSVTIFDLLVYYDIRQHRQLWADVASDAINNSDLHTIEFLAKMGHDFFTLDGHNESAVDLAIQRDCIEMMAIFEKYGTNFHRLDKKPFLTAARCGSLKCMKYLSRQKGFDVNTVDAECGGNALHIAALYGMSESVEFIIDHKADLDHRSSNGRTAAMHAAKYGYIEVLELLIQHHINLEQTDHQGRSLLMIAAEYGQDEIFQCLMKHGVRLTATNLSALNKNTIEFFIADYPEQLLELLVSINDLNGFSPEGRNTLKKHAGILDAAMKIMLSKLEGSTKHQEILQLLEEKPNGFTFLFERPTYNWRNRLFAQPSKIDKSVADKQYFQPQFDF